VEIRKQAASDLHQGETVNHENSPLQESEHLPPEARKRESRRGGARLGSGRKPARLQTLLGKMAPRKAQQLQRDVRRLAVRVLTELSRSSDMQAAVAQSLLSMEQQRRSEINVPVEAEIESTSGRGGRRSGAGAKPATVIAVLAKMPAELASRFREDVSEQVMKEIGSIATRAAIRKPAQRGRKRKDELATLIIQRKDIEGLSWSRVTSGLNKEAALVGRTALTEDAYRSLYRTYKKRLLTNSRGGSRPGAGAKAGTRGRMVKIPAGILTTPGEKSI